MRVLRAVRIDACAGGYEKSRKKKGMSMRLMHALSGTVSADDIVTDGIWRLRITGSPDLYMRLRGEGVLQRLLKYYTFTDASGCNYNEDTVAIASENLEKNARLVETTLPLPPASVPGLLKRQQIYRRYGVSLPTRFVECLDFVQIMGLPQRTVNSGSCWYGSVLYTLLNDELRAIVLDSVLSSKIGCSGKVARLIEAAAFISDTAGGTAAEELRRLLFDEFKIGDDPAIRPEEEGQNGATQFAMICQTFGVPGVIAFASGDSLTLSTAELVSKNVRMDAMRRPLPSERGILLVRVAMQVWHPPDTLYFDGRRWYLQACYLGSELCGHQTALVRGKESFWHHYDCDSTRMGVGPSMWKSVPGQFWRELGLIFKNSNHTEISKFCSFSPHSVDVLDIVKGHFRANGVMLPNESRDHASRFVNVDWVYVSGV